MVMVPATSGQMGVLPGHVPTIAEMKPGILSVHDGTEVKQYFVSSGFAFVHANSVADIVAIEAVPLDRFDPEEIRRGVQEFSQKMNTANSDLEKAEAQIGLEVHSALQAALGVTAWDIYSISQTPMFWRMSEMSLRGLWLEHNEVVPFF